MRYAAGQIWKYHHRPGEEGSRLTIVHIDTEPGYGNIIHIAVGGLFIRATQATPGHIHEMSHLPFTQDAIDQSVTDLVKTLPNPPAKDGYLVWREAFDKGEAGVFSLPLIRLITITEQSLVQHLDAGGAADGRWV